LTEAGAGGRRETGSPAQQAQALLKAGRSTRHGCFSSEDLAGNERDGDARYVLAVCQRLAKDFAAAQDALELLLERDPDNGRALQELGHLARDRGIPERHQLRYYG
jgi:thioredoxin-like negative regulator of GroEL